MKLLFVRYFSEHIDQEERIIMNVLRNVKQFIQPLTRVCKKMHFKQASARGVHPIHERS